MSQSQLTGGSWLSKSDRADASGGEYTASTRPSRKRPLTECDGVTLRRDVQDYGDLDGDRPVTWNGAIRRWRDYIEDRDGVQTVFKNEAGDTVRTSKPHRFDPEYSEKQYAKLKDLERGVQDAYGKRLRTAMLTLTASSTPNDEPLPPVDHLNELLSSWDAVRRALDRVLDGTRFARLGILEPHPGNGPNNGYLHVHIAVFVDGCVQPEEFQPVLDAHVRNCEYARPEAHGTEDVQVRHTGLDRADRADPEDDEQLDELAIYLAEYLGTYGDDDPLSEPEHVQASNALLWATERQRWRPCSTAQQFMKHDPADGPETAETWTLAGIEKDDEFIPAGDESGGVDRFTTGPVPPD